MSGLMVQIRNNSDQPLAIWWGATMYDLPPHDIITVERVIAEAAIKHIDYRPLFEQGVLEFIGATDIYQRPTSAPSVDGSSGPVQPPSGEQPPAKPEGTQPWAGPASWNSLEAPINEVRAYCAHFQLKFSDDMEEDDLRQAVDEHYLSQE